MIQLDESDAALSQPSGQEAVVGIRRLAWFSPIHIERSPILFRDVHELRHAGLHAVGHFERGDTRGDLGVSHRLQVLSIDLSSAVDQPAADLRRNSLRIVHEQDGFGPGTELHALMVGGQETTAPIPGEQRLILPLPRSQNDKGRQLLILTA